MTEVFEQVFVQIKKTKPTADSKKVIYFHLSLQVKDSMLFIKKQYHVLFRKWLHLSCQRKYTQLWPPVYLLRIGGLVSFFFKSNPQNVSAENAYRWG